MDLAFEACSKSTAELVVYEGLAATLDLKPKESESTARLGFPVVGIYQIAFPHPPTEILELLLLESGIGLWIVLGELIVQFQMHRPSNWKLRVEMVLPYVFYTCNLVMNGTTRLVS